MILYTLSFVEMATTVSDIFQATGRVAALAEQYADSSKSRRFGIFPIQDHAQFRRMKVLESMHWTAEEVNFTEDILDFRKLSGLERSMLEKAFGFFAVGDGNIASMIALRMIAACKNIEQSLFFVTQLNNERVHAETYGRMIVTLVDPSRVTSILEAASQSGATQEMSNFIDSSITNATSLAEAYLALCSAEYICFIPLFCLIFWFKAFRPGILKGVILSNEFIARDEAIHAENGWCLYNSQPALPSKQVYDFIDNVVRRVKGLSAEIFQGQSFVSEAEGSRMNERLVNQYIEFVADDLLSRLQLPSLYGSASPFPFMKLTQLAAKTNFYEGMPTEYSHLNVDESVSGPSGETEKENIFEVCPDF